MNERLKEIKERKLQLKNDLEDKSKPLNLEEVSKEIDDLAAEERGILSKVEEESKKEKEERKSREDLAKNIDENNLGTKMELEEKKMNEEKKFNIASPEYRSAWAKKLMGYPEKDFTEDEKRALGDAVGTSATTFTQSQAEQQGVNNFGLAIPTSIRTELLERLEKVSPIFRDIRKIQVNGNVDLPYLFAADDAEWYAELKNTKNEGQELKGLKLTGYELAKDIVITWKAELMTVEGFIDFILDELFEKMAKAKINGVIYGTGENMPTGITHNVSPIKTGDTPIDTIKDILAKLDKDAKIGAKVYISSAVSELITFYKDTNGNYPFLVAGLSGNNMPNIEMDPFLKDNDIVVGNMRNYILNELTDVSIGRESTLTGRKTTYGAYQLVDGAPRPNYFGYGQFQSTP